MMRRLRSGSSARFRFGRCFKRLVSPAFIDAMPGHLPGDAASQERLPDLEDNKLRALARLE